MRDDKGEIVFLIGFFSMVTIVLVVALLTGAHL